VKVNQRVRELDCVDDVYVHPNMGDGGLAMGAAYAVWSDRVHRAGEVPLPRFLPTVYLGPSYSDAQIESALKKSGLAYEKHADIENRVAELIRQDRIVGRFNGRMEYGPRALGNRSILASATDKRINDWLNKRLKRTEFMPFAPSILEEDAADFFLGWSSQHTPARFMAMTYDMPNEKAALVPAVSHVDLTARPQVVRKKDNPSYYRIIERYKALTGLPVIINTSFNMHEEPIVCTPEDAIRSLVDGSVDVLAIGNYIVHSP
jgi:carbamoyltransferase